MARSTFGGYGGDQVSLDPAGNSGFYKAAANYNATGTFWSASTGGTQYTDLIDPVTSVALAGVSTDAHGHVVPFKGPDGITEGWVDFGAGRFKVTATDAGAFQTSTGMDTAVNALVTTAGTATRGSGFSAFGKKIAFDVTDPTFGADPTGATNAQPAFAAAVAAAGDGGTVLVPTGTYRLSSTLVIAKDVILRGMGRSKTVLLADAGVTAIKTDQVGSDIPQNWQIRDLTVQSASGTSGKLANPVVTLGTTAASGGTFGAGTYFWAVSAINAVGETLAATEVSAAIAANGTQVLNWAAITGATGYKVYRGTASYNYGATALVATLGTVATYTDTGTATTTGAPLDTATASGSDIGIYVRWGPGLIENCDVNYFGSHGVLVEASSTLGSTQASHTRISHQTKCYNNGGDGIRIQGQDAQACIVDQPNCVLNYGWGVKVKDSSSNEIRKPHADQQYNGSPGAFWDNALGNAWLDLYSEGGKRIRLHSGCVGPWVTLSNYGRPVIENPGNTGVILDGETGFSTYIRLSNPTLNSLSWLWDSGATAVSALTLKYTGSLYGGAKTVSAYYRNVDTHYFNSTVAAFADASFDLGVAGQRFRNLSLSGVARTGQAATASRPSASTSGAGAMFYDTTLSKPIWSDGTVWRDATGTAV